MIDKRKGIVNKLLEAHQQKHELLEAMAGITGKMCSNEMDQAEELLGLIEARQACINKINELDQIIKQALPEAELLRRTAEGYLSREWNKIELIIDSEKKLIKNMLDMDLIQKEKMENVFSGFKKQGDKLRAGWQTLGAYRLKPAHSKSIFIDKKK